MEMAKQRNPRRRNRHAAGTAPKPPAPPAPAPKPPPVPAEPRPVFHSERRPGRIGDYVILAALEHDDSGRLTLVGRVRIPNDGTIEVCRRLVPGVAPESPDARRGFGAPGGLDPELLRETLAACRAWVHQDNARRRPAADEPPP
jgi:hypothetical protein